ncbi:AAA family ATPase [Candidatus Woesearchaeota archaeon]|nr:AAA family ATPase [Candidatus Woesearchaeota archaeon]
MFIKSIKLTNIRSYESAQIEFPPGATLLAGDIGSGKSTILQAIEFALFGVRRKGLSASSLLRHGKQKGEVELAFIVEKKEIIIKRALKRGKEDIQQEAGFIIIDGMKKEGTHVELKSIILSLLGYPQDLVSKSKDLVFRFTVYTPQEEMKQIILEEAEERLNTLRRVFNIDKYKRIQENTKFANDLLREKLRLCEGLLADFEEKQKELQEKESLLKSLSQHIEALLPALSAKKEMTAQKKASLESYEQKVREAQRLKKEIALKEYLLAERQEQLRRAKKEIERISPEIEALAKELAEKEIPNLQEFITAINEKEALLHSHQQEIISLNRALASIDTRKSHSLKVQSDILKLDQCPLCLQNVAHSHKAAIAERESSLIRELEQGMASQREKENNLKSVMDSLRKELGALREKGLEVKAMLAKRQMLKEKESRKAALGQEQETLQKEIESAGEEKKALALQAGNYLDIEYAYSLRKQEHQKALEEEHSLEIQIRQYEARKQEMAKGIASLKVEIERKEQAKLQLQQNKALKYWIDELFLNLMGTMEKHVFASVYNEFNMLFQEWLALLIEDEALQARLDDSFSPAIIQDGFDAEVEALSGGEKTAVALAYRLALNKVINDVISGIKTKSIIILDEPTDGFSSEQLDRVRVVLDRLGMEQVILVSHEAKIEGFVDNVIRVRKEGHVSKAG